MGQTTIISWTQRTWNPWRGCTKISPGCRNCYMFTAQERYGRDPRVVVRTKTWNDPLRWQRRAEREGRREFVFTCSWSDWFHEAADAWRDEAWDVVRRCPNLAFQILTKRPERAAGHLPADWGGGYDNVWLGVSIESNDYVWRADILRTVPAAVRFISAEPLLGPLPDLDLTGIDWLIVGGESGPGFRPMDLDWARQLRDRATGRGTAFFFKQSAAPRTETGTSLDGRQWRQMPAASGEANQEASLFPEDQVAQKPGGERRRPLSAGWNRAQLVQWADASHSVGQCRGPCRRDGS